jgi:hypothetical protein
MINKQRPMTNNSLRLVQLFHPESQRSVAVVQEPNLIILRDTSSIYQLTLEAIDSGKKIKDIVDGHVSSESLDYASIYGGDSEWKILPAFDHPENLMNCLVSGTGLTHKNSALNRQIMHQSANEKLTDSMIIFQWGVEGGFPAKGTIGIQPEWFHKGNGSLLKAHNEVLEVPSFGNDGGEEPEIAGIYIIDRNGNPRRVGFTTANEFSDHVMEKKNYLYLAPSKLRNCSIGPELVIDEDFDHLTGSVKIIRGSQMMWSSEIHTGEKHMAHSLENLEYHHFKYSCHRIPLQAHVHFFGADAFSYGKMELQEGDVMEIQWEGMGRALKNTLHISNKKEELIKVKSLNE